MTNSIVEQLRSWLSSRTPKLVSEGVEIIDRIPGPLSNIHWSGTVGLVKNDIFVSFTVWGLTIFQTELIIVDGNSKETVLSKDGTPERVEEIDAILDEVVDGLISGKYRRA